MKNNKGFTLMELLLSISVLALIMLIAIPSYIGISNAVRKNQRENIISKIETAASKYAFDTGETLIFVDKLITEGYIDSDDEKGNLDDPVNNLRMNCYVVEMTRENSYYKAEFKNDKNYDEDGVCNYNKLEESSSNVSIIATGEKTGDWYKGKVTLTATSNKIVIDCTNNTCKWTSSSGLDKNGESIEVDSKGILNTKYTFQYTIYNQEDNTVTRYKDAMTLKIDNEAPVIYNEQITVSDRYVYTDNKTVKIIASDGKGSGINGYALSKNVSVCSASELNYQESNSFKVDEVGTYKVCVKDKVNNYSEYNLEIKYINPKYTVTVSSNNESYGTVNPGSQPVTSGKSAVFTISPKDGYQYKSNTCDGTVSDNILTIENVTADKTCVVNFEPLYTVKVNSNNTSYGTVNPGSQSVSSGGTLTFTISPKSGYKYSSNDCGATKSGNTLTLSNVTSDISCTVYFYKQSTTTYYSVTVNSNDTTYGTVSPQYSTVISGNSATFTLNPKSGYEYKSNNCGGTVSGNTMTISSVNKNINCTVTFGRPGVTITVNSNKFGTVTPSTQTVDQGGTAIFTITPAPGFEFFEDLNFCGGTLSGNILTINNVTSNRTCSVYFAELYSVNVKSNNTTYGTVSPTGSVTIPYMPDSITNSPFKLTPAPGYEYKSNTCGGTVSENAMWLTNIRNDLDCTVTFGRITYTVEVSSNNESYGTVSPSSQTVVAGESATFTLSPATRYRYWRNTCGGTVSGNTLTINNVTSDISCAVSFEQKTYYASIYIYKGTDVELYRECTKDSGCSFAADATYSAYPGFKMISAKVPAGCKVNAVGDTGFNWTCSEGGPYEIYIERG